MGLEGSKNSDFVEEANKTSLIFYSDKNNVSRKYISQYGSLSRTGDYYCNKNCLTEVFNMLDIVAQLKLAEFQNKSIPLPDRKIRGRDNVGFLYQGRAIYYWKPKGFRNRIVALRKYGCQISDSIDDVVRIARNFTTHGNATVVLDVRPLSYEYTKGLMLIMANALVEMGYLDPKDRIPTFDRMRIHPGSYLQTGKYLIGPQIMESKLFRMYKGTQKTLGRKLAIAELKPDMIEEKVMLDESLLLQKIKQSFIQQVYDVFYENETWYIVMEYQAAIEGVEKTLRKEQTDTFLNKAIRNAVAGLNLSPKGMDTFKKRVERRYQKETGRSLEEADISSDSDKKLLDKIIQEVYQEFVDWAIAHHIPIRKET